MIDEGSQGGLCVGSRQAEDSLRSGSSRFKVGSLRGGGGWGSTRLGQQTAQDHRPKMAPVLYAQHLDTLLMLYPHHPAPVWGSRWGHGGSNKGVSTKGTRSLSQNDPSFICPASGHIADLVPPSTQYQHGGQGVVKVGAGGGGGGVDEVGQ